MTTTTPESRARLAYTAYLRGKHNGQPFPDEPLFDQLSEEERRGWHVSANMLWDLAKTGRATI